MSNRYSGTIAVHEVNSETGVAFWPLEVLEGLADTVGSIKVNGVEQVVSFYMSGLHLMASTGMTLGWAPDGDTYFNMDCEVDITENSTQITAINKINGLSVVTKHMDNEALPLEPDL